MNSGWAVSDGVFIGDVTLIYILTLSIVLDSCFQRRKRVPWIIATNETVLHL
jgi:hypothetical protein